MNIYIKLWFTEWCWLPAIGHDTWADEAGEEYHSACLDWLFLEIGAEW